MAKKRGGATTESAAVARTALVTGGNRGIGLAVCRALIERGVSVLLGARKRVEGDDARASLRPDRCEVVVIDVADAESVARAASDLEGRGRCVDILVNNAGVYPGKAALASTLEEWDAAIRVNVLGAIHPSRAFVPGMLARGWGRVVNVSSGYGLFGEGLGGPAPYAVSKAALNAFTVKLAEEVGRTTKKVKVNAACPGWVRTRMGGDDADRSPEQGAAGIVELALLPDDGPSGGFFRDGEPIPW